MAELIYRHIYKVDVANDPLIRRDVGALLGLYDKAANRFGVELYDNGTALTLSGKTVTGYMIRPDGNTVNLSGTVSGNQAFVELTENCYLYDGAFTLTLKVGTQTVLICDGQIAVTRTGTTVSGNEVINTVSNAETLGGKPPEYYIQPRNLLDNSWFGGRYVGGVKEELVYQAGLNGKHGTAKYPMDRWISWSADVTFADGYITPGTPIDQHVANIDTNKIYTVAMKLNGGTILAYSGTFAAGFGSSSILRATIDTNFSVPNVRIIGTQNVCWVALYEGAYTAETLPPYVPKGYGAELIECLRYYRVSSNPRRTYVATNATYLAASHDFAIPMRTTPTATNVWISSLGVPNTNIATSEVVVTALATGVVAVKTPELLTTNGYYYFGADYSADL